MIKIGIKIDDDGKVEVKCDVKKASSIDVTIAMAQVDIIKSHLLEEYKRAAERASMKE